MHLNFTPNLQSIIVQQRSAVESIFSFPSWSHGWPGAAAVFHGQHSEGL